MVLILVEPSYSRSVWCLNLLDGLTSEFKQKRVPFRQIASLDEADADDRYIYLIGSDNAWVRAALTACNRLGVYPILLCNQAYHTFDADYSTVCSDVINSMRRLVELLRARGHGRIALYGVNPQSVSDESRMNSYLAARAAAGEEDGRQDVFFNSGSLENCFEEFMGRADEYDAVICANDFAAISLVRRLGLRDKAQLERLAIAGCADARLAQLYGGHILSVRVNFVEYGRAAVTLLENLRKNPYLSHIIMMIRWDFSLLDGAVAPAPPPRPREKAPALPDEPDVFYEDRELNEMMLLEKLLGGCEDPDHEIIRLLLRGEPYEKIAETCFLTESAIKYRIKKMVRTCCVQGRKELTALLRRYLPGGDPGGH
ncbi:substrate-binding domain-containing protein [Anaerofilum sp. BX8]|uniref:Substrate-binding domain-containing protein n=1 Tax=Anaerofilum hominis TaxID=2763016 RepID=A0A923I7A4_9FIRM|nr:substrate-binding domain-containing protein [Anaerofilum hominis]MBC5581596.1 substrate-binding domain-containing protein [Anaerofilum hominis]